MLDTNELYRHAIERLGEGVYFCYAPENGKSYSVEIKREDQEGKNRFYTVDGDIRIYTDTADFEGYIRGLDIVGVVQLGIPYNKPSYVPLNFL